MRSRVIVGLNRRAGERIKCSSLHCLLASYAPIDVRLLGLLCSNIYVKTYEMTDVVTHAVLTDIGLQNNRIARSASDRHIGLLLAAVG